MNNKKINKYHNEISSIIDKIYQQQKKKKKITEKKEKKR